MNRHKRLLLTGLHKRIWGFEGCKGVPYLGLGLGLQTAIRLHSLGKLSLFDLPGILGPPTWLW